MDAVERITGLYMTMRETYGKAHADDMLGGIMARAQVDGAITFEQAVDLYIELTDLQVKGA